MNAATHRELRDEIKRRTDAREIAADAMGPGKTAGRGRQYRHPATQQKTGSFTVYANGFFDHKTGERGDVIALYMLLYGVSYLDARAALASRAGLDQHPVPHHTPRPAPCDNIAETDVIPDTRWQQIAADLIRKAVAKLWDASTESNYVLAYLRNERGLTDETIRATHLGYNPQWLRTEYKGDETRPAYLAPGIVIPWYASDSTLHAIRVRTRVGNLATALGIADDTQSDGNPLAKYLGFRGSRPSVYIARAAQSGKPVLLVEGEFDALIAAQKLPNGIGVLTLGSAAGSIKHAQSVLRAASCVLPCLDNDTAGEDYRVADRCPQCPRYKRDAATCAACPLAA